MGVLTRDLTRLRNEILAMRSARQVLIHDLERETGGRRADVAHMLADFSEGLGTVARKTKAHCRGSISDLQRTVSVLRTGIRTDLSGIRHTWLALGAPSRSVVEGREGRANAEGRPSETESKHSRELVRGEKPARRKRKR